MANKFKRAIGPLLLAIALYGPGGAVAAEKVFGGVGLQVVPTAKGELVVLKVLEGAPAAASGLRPGDLIVEVDDFPLAGSDFADVARRYLWGEVGSTVSLKYLRPGKEGRHAVTLRRSHLKTDDGSPPGVKMLAPGGGEQ